MSTASVAIVDYGMGNVGSIKNMVAHVGGSAETTKDRESLGAAPKLILAGVGAFDEGMRRLDEPGLRPQLEELVLRKRVPLLAICVGMQLLFEGSEEGIASGLGWIPGRVRRFPNFSKESSLKVPHMGWNTVLPAKESRLTRDLPVDTRFYFVHSYYCECADLRDSLLTTSHGIEFTSAIERENIFGVQFHPEKSHRYGMTILRNFLAL